MSKLKVTIYTDGSSLGNPGAGGYGAVLLYLDKQGLTHTKELSCGYACTTNNRMELMGAIAALEALKMPCEVGLHSDSNYLVEAFKKNWIKNWEARGWKTADKKPVKNYDLWQRLLHAKKLHDVHFIWVKGHAGDTYNERCDILAKAAAQSEHLLIDEGYQTSSQKVQ